MCVEALLYEIRSHFCIPRFVDSSKKGTDQLLIFSDASTNCYATAVYLRSIDGPLSKTNLIFAKPQIVPVNKGKGKCTKSDGNIDWCAFS